MADKQLNAIEQQMEATRERLAATIDELAYRASPKTIAQREVSAFKGFWVDASGKPRVDNIAKAAGAVAGAVALFVLIRKVTH